MRLFHFSDDPAIERFVPRPVRVPAQRAVGQEWLNGPLVWAIDEAHQPMYLFPRDCPRVLIWSRAETTASDREKWLGGSRFAAYVEDAWLQRLEGESLLRYELPALSFTSLEDAGMWVSRETVVPVQVDPVSNLPAELDRHRVDLRIVPHLGLLGDLRASSLHVSAIRLRNARPVPVASP